MSNVYMHIICITEVENIFGEKCQKFFNISDRYKILYPQSLKNKQQEKYQKRKTILIIFKLLNTRNVDKILKITRERL